MPQVAIAAEQNRSADSCVCAAYDSKASVGEVIMAHV